MKNINHRQIRLVFEDLNPYDTTIACELPMPKFIIDKYGRLFQKAKTIFEPGKCSKVLYYEVPVTVLSSVEAPPGVVVVANYATQFGEAGHG